MVDSKFRNREPVEDRAPRRTAGRGLRPSGKGARRSRELVSAETESLERLAALIEELRGSRLWRLIERPLRWCLNPGTLGRGHTIFDDIGAQLRDVREANLQLTNALVPAEVRFERGPAHHGNAYPAAVLVTNWNGAAHIDAFLDSYARHHVPDAAELVIVDHASSDDSVARIRARMNALPIKLLRCNRNQRYAVANNLAAAYADSPCLVFANNDIVFDSPVIPGLLSALADTSVCLAGVPLYYPDGQGAGTRRVQHAGIRFAPSPHLQFMRPHNVHDPVPEGGGCRRVPAVTGALAACRREDFESVGGFLEDYDYGFEDVDLSLNLQSRLGQEVVVCDGLSAIHDESRTQKTIDEAVLVARRRRNARTFRARFGAQLSREVFRSQLHGGIWHEEPLRLRLTPRMSLRDDTGDGGDESVQQVPAASLEGQDRERFCGFWLLDDPAELAEAALPKSAVGVALVARNRAEDWLGISANPDVALYLCQSERDLEALRHRSCADLVRAPGDAWPPGARTTRAVLDALSVHQERPSIAIRSASPRAESARYGCDFHFAKALARALRDRGYRVNLDGSADAQQRRIEPDDVTLTLRGPQRFTAPVSGLNLLWLISHAERVSDQEFEGYDHVFVASASYAAHLAERIPTPVTALLRCTDPACFPFIEAPTHPERIVFVGHSRGVEGPVLKAALSQGLNPEVYGRDWGGLVSPSDLHEGYVDNYRLGALYGNSGVVLHDHGPLARRDGFVSNRIFDALATGAHVVSDAVAGLDELFGEEVGILSHPEDDLAGLCRAGSSGRAARQALASRVAEEHSFAVRAARIDALIRSRMPAVGPMPARRSAA